MSMYGSQKNLSMGRRVASKADLSAGGNQFYPRGDLMHGGGNGYEPFMMDGFTGSTLSRTSMGGIGMK